MAEEIKTPQQMAEQIVQAQPAQPLQNNTIPAENIQAPATPVAPIQPEAPQSQGVLNLGDGKIINKSSAKYQKLIQAGYTDDRIVSEYQKKQQKATTQPTAQQTSTVEKNATVQPSVSIDYKDDSEARQQKIVNNLNQSLQSNPGLFQDRELFNQSFKYNDRSALQKKILDNWYANNIEKATVISSISRQPAVDIAKQYNNGSIKDTDLTNLKQIDPAKYTEVQKEIEKEKTRQKYQSILYGDQEENTGMKGIIDAFKTILQPKAQSTMYEDYKNALNTPEMKNMRNELSAKEGEIKQIDEQIRSTRTQLEKQFEGSGISQGRLNAIIQDQVQLLQDKRNGLAIEYQTQADKYNNSLTTIKDTLEAQEKQYQMDLQQEQQLMQKYNFAYGMYSDMQAREDKFKMADMQFLQDVEKMGIQQQKQLETALGLDKINSGDINSKDPYLVEKAIGKNVDSIMAQFDGLIDISRDQLVEKVKADMKAGKSYSESLNSIMDGIRKQPQFREYMNNKAGVSNNPVQWGEDFYVYNGKGYTTDELRVLKGLDPVAVAETKKRLGAMRATGALSQYDDTDKASRVINGEIKTRNGNAFKVGEYGGRCGEFVNDMMFGRSSGLFGDTIDSKIAWTQNPDWYSPVPIVGGAVVIDNGVKVNGVDAGHIAYVTKVNPDGSFDYVDSNGNGNKTMGKKTGVKQGNNTYFTQAPGKNGNNLLGGGIGGGQNIDNVLKTIMASGKFTKEQSANLKSALEGGGDIPTILKNQAKMILGATESKELTNLEVAQQSMKDVYSALDEYYKAGGNTNYIKGNMEKVINGLGDVKDAKLVGIATKIQRSLQKYRNAISGTAYSEQEGKDIASVFPGISKSQGLNQAIMDASIEQFQSDINSTYRVAIGGAYDKFVLGQPAQNVGLDKAVEVNMDNMFDTLGFLR